MIDAFRKGSLGRKAHFVVSVVLGIVLLAFTIGVWLYLWGVTDGLPNFTRKQRVFGSIIPLFFSFASFFLPYASWLSLTGQLGIGIPEIDDLDFSNDGPHKPEKSVLARLVDTEWIKVFLLGTASSLFAALLIALLKGQ